MWSAAQLGEALDIAADLGAPPPVANQLACSLVQHESPDDPQMVEERVTIPAHVGELLKSRRLELGLSQRTVCEAVGIRQPVTFYAWEKGALRPILSHFTRYLDVLELEREPVAAT